MNTLPEHFLPENLLRFVLSTPAASPYKRITGELSKKGFRLQKLTDTKAFTENIKPADVLTFLDNALSGDFKNLTAWDETIEYSVKISKKGKVFTGRKKSEKPISIIPHNREKNYLIKEGEYVPALYDMGLFNEDGSVKAPMRDKFRQLNRLLEIIDDVIKDVPPEKTLKIVDFGCGKSYLTFALYHFLRTIKKRDAIMIGLDLKEDVIKNCNATAQKYGYENLSFQTGDVASADIGDFDMMITLHACDTATDFALHYAVTHGVKYIFSVPCCQKEINAQIKADTFPLMLSHGLTKERFSALLTDSIRTGLLTANGYSTDMMEFVGFDSTPKNILIRAKRANISPSRRREALCEVQKSLEYFHIKQTFYTLLNGEKND